MRAIDFPCPMCGAVVGQRCLKENNKRRGWPHEARWALSKRWIEDTSKAAKETDAEQSEPKP